MNRRAMTLGQDCALGIVSALGVAFIVGLAAGLFILLDAVWP